MRDFARPFAPDERVDVRPKLRNRAVEMADVPERPSLHHAAFHDAECKLGQTLKVGVGRKALCRSAKLLLNRRDPHAEIGREQFTHGFVWLMQFESEAAYRASVGAICLDKGSPRP